MTLSDAVNHIAGQAGPVVCLDTCVYLDIIRRATSGQQLLTEMARYEDLVSQGVFVPVMPSIIADEYARNIDGVTAEAKNTMRDAVESWNGLQPVTRQAAGGVTIPVMDRRAADTAVEFLKTKSKSLLDLAVLVDPGSQIDSNVIQRQSVVKRPAQRGKNSFGDCFICETVLALAAALRAAGSPSPIYFVTSNKTDFGDERPGMQAHAHPDLVPEFGALGINYEPVLAAMLWGAF